MSSESLGVATWDMRFEEMRETVYFEQGSMAEEHRRDAAAIVCEAFEAKISALSMQKEAAIEVLVESLNPGSAIFAYQGEELVGVAGIVTNTSRFLESRWGELLKHLDPFRALVYYLVVKFDSRVSEGEMKIEALGVSRGIRGQGIGTELVRRVEGLASEKGYTVLSLDVVDTNAAARKLYEKLGFEVVKTTEFGILTRKAGFTSSYHLRKRIK